MTMTPLQCRLARTGLGLAVRDVAFLAGVAAETMTRIEKGESVRISTIEKVANVYKFLGVIFIDDAEKPGIMIDLARLSEIKLGSHDLAFADLNRKSAFVDISDTLGPNLRMLGAFMRSIEAGKPWTTNGF